MADSRAEQIKRIAYDLDLEYQPKDEWGLLNLLEDFKLFRRGRRKRIEHILRRQDAMLDTDARIFDYSYTIHANNSRRTVAQTVFFMHSKKLGLPEFWMKPEHFFHNIGEFLGFTEDIDFEEHPKFSKQYWLKSGDEPYLRASLSDPFLKFFTIEQDWHLEGINYYLIFYKKEQLLTPKQIKDFYKKGMQICEMLYEQKFL